MAAPAQAVSADDLRAFVSSKHAFTLVESPLRGKYENLTLVGRPDALHFDGAGNAWVVEHKVRSRDYPTASDDVQLRLYAYLLLGDSMFQVDDVTLVCASTSRETSERIKRLPESERAAFVREICGAAPGDSQPRKLMKDHFIEGRKSQRVSVATFAYDDAKLQNELRFLSGYWLGKRRTKPTTKPYKCGACRINALGMCPVPLAPFREPSHSARDGKKL